MSIEFNEFVIRECHNRNLPCIPDPNDPVVAIEYIAQSWLVADGKKALYDLYKTARILGLVDCVLMRKPCVALSNVRKLLIAFGSADGIEVEDQDVLA